MLRYTLMRLGIFVGCFVVVWALVYSGIAPRGLGASNGMWMIMLALVVSAPISFVALRKERDRASEQIAPRLDRSIGRVKSNLAANRSQEDEADDVARSGNTPSAEDRDGDEPAKASGTAEAPEGVKAS
ncbi:DUF4229 domain-containing protein [Streptomyces sp. HM190]|uniref:DUF4229 domain-containing protein n=1 Tax=Streptomyces sp. HM190 TaxID=2695266 RepID=UPI00135A1304|nr:DUF4229 domain-containing protein [Streptomyces sp. HM190]